LASLLLFGGLAVADGPKDNIPDNVRRVPPPGTKVPGADREELQAKSAELAKKIDGLKTSLKGKPALLELLPDVQIYHKAVQWALDLNQIYDAKQIPAAKKLLEQGMERASQLEKGQAPWNTATGLVVRGYLSKIDGSVQPYGLVV